MKDEDGERFKVVRIDAKAFGDLKNLKNVPWTNLDLSATVAPSSKDGTASFKLELFSYCKKSKDLRFRTL